MQNVEFLLELVDIPGLEIIANLFVLETIDPLVEVVVDLVTEYFQGNEEVFRKYLDFIG